MPIEIRNPAAPDQIVATYDETPDNALDEVVARAMCPVMRLSLMILNR